MPEIDAKFIAAVFAVLSAVLKACAASNGRFAYPPKLLTDDEIAKLGERRQRRERKKIAKEEGAVKRAKRRLDWFDAFSYATGIVAAVFALYALT